MALISTVSLEFHLPTFDGPLDLLLHLIREQRIDVYDIPIALITRQYLEYLAHWESLDLAIAGEYLVIAATLVEIKSRMLLPKPPSDAEDALEDPRDELVQKLLEYERYRGLNDTLREWEDFRRTLYFRGALENPEDYVLPVSAGEMSPDVLVQALRRVLAAAGVEEAVTTIVPRRRISLKMRMADVARRIQANPEGLQFETLFDLPCPVADIVLTFLAVLELVKLGRIDFRQAGLDDLIVLPPPALAA